MYCDFDLVQHVTGLPPAAPTQHRDAVAAAISIAVNKWRETSPSAQLRRRRLQVGWTLEETAVVLDVPPAYLLAIEENRVPFPTALAPRIEAKLNIRLLLVP